MKIIHASLFLFIAVDALPATAAGDSAAACVSRWHVQQWTTEHGLPQNNVKAIAQTPDGYLWLGTLSGLARFDGVSFTTYTRGNTPGLVSDAINALTVDGEGTLWVATADGLVAWRQGVVGHWAEAEGMPGKSVFGVVIAPGGVWWREGYWCGRLKDGRITRYGLEHGLATNSVWSITTARDGGLIALTHLGVQRLEVDRERFGELVSWPVAGEDWRGCEDATGRLWVSANAGMFRREGNRWVSLSGSNGIQPGTRLFEDRAGRMWTADREKGLRWLDGAELPSAPVLKTEEKGFSALFEDREGNLWAGVGGEGLFRLRPERIRSWTKADGLPGRSVRSVSAGPDGSVWLGMEGGLTRIRAGRVQTFPELEPDTAYGMYPVWADRSGAVWGFKWGRGLYRFDGRRFERLVVMPEAPHFFVNSFCQDRAGRLCLGIDRGVSVFHEGRFERLFGSNVVGDYVFTMLEDRAGGWWLGMKGGGVKRFEGGSVTSFTTTNGLSDNKAMCFHEDAEGTIWIGTDKGLNRFKEGRLTILRTSDGLPENTVHHILEDDSGNLWWSGLRGVHRASRAQLNAVGDGRTNRVSCFTYGEADGMASSETNGELQPAGCKTPDGRLWFPTIKGVVEIDPRLLIESEIAPPVVIEQVKADGVIGWGEGSESGPVGKRESGMAEARHAVGSALNLGSGQGRVIELHYTANCLSAPEKVRFQWKLEPRDQQWHDAGSQRFVFLQNLRPGRYTFRVQACNQHGLWNEAGAGLAFILAPHFYETRMFYVLCAGGVALAGFAVHHWRVRFQRHILRLEHARALEGERARLAHDLHDELGTALTGLALEVDVARRGIEGQSAATGRLRHTADRARAMAARMREVVWAISPRCDDVPGLVTFLEQHAAPFVRDAGLRCRLEFPEELPALPLAAEARHQLALAVREALTNVVRHARAGEVVLSLRLERGRIVVQIRDDGAGFDPAKVNGGGHGLENLGRRLENFGGGAACDSRPGHGTILTLHLPLSPHHHTPSRPA